MSTTADATWPDFAISLSDRLDRSRRGRSIVVRVMRLSGFPSLIRRLRGGGLGPLKAFLLLSDLAILVGWRRWLPVEVRAVSSSWRLSGSTCVAPLNSRISIDASNSARAAIGTSFESSRTVRTTFEFTVSLALAKTSCA